MIRRRLRTPDARWALAIFALALIVRLLMVAVVHPDPRDGRFDDSLWYDTSARHLADGDGYVFDPTVWVRADGGRIYPDENELTPTAVWPPGYPITLAAIYLVTDDSLWAGRLFNVLAGALTAVLTYAIARKLFSLMSGAIAGMLMAVFPGHVLFTPVLMSETYFGLLMAATLAAFLYFVLDRDEPRPLAAAATGLLVGGTAMVRGEFILFAGLLALLLVMHLGPRRALVPAAALALGVAALFVPWTVRNAVQMGEPIVGTTGAGRVALQGHHELSEGIPDLWLAWLPEALHSELPRKERELAANRTGSKLAREFAREHPLEELRLIPRRMYGMFRSDESAVTWTQSNKPWYSEPNADRLIRISNVFFFSTIALALIGWPLWWRTRDPKRLLIFAPAPYYMLVFGVIFIGDPRYHYGMYMTLVVLATPALTALLGVTAAGWREVAGGKSFGEVLRRYGTPPPSARVP